MTKRTDIKSVMVVGSGPIVIGQAAEFDYSGTQACRVLREEGIRVILVNSNPEKPHRGKTPVHGRSGECFPYIRSMPASKLLLHPHPDDW